jgi:hypothetical protein
VNQLPDRRRLHSDPPLGDLDFSGHTNDHNIRSW